MASPERVTQVDYPLEITTASRGALEEAVDVLGRFRDALVLIGGWVAPLLLEEKQRPDVSFRHVGSVDVDWLVDAARLPRSGGATMVQALESAGFTRSNRYDFRLERRLPDGPDLIGVDFLTPDPDPDGRAAFEEACRVVGLRLGEVSHTAVALRHTCEWGIGPRRVRMVTPAGFLVLKGLALQGRDDPKDAYDVWSVCRYYGERPGAIGMELRPHLGDGDLLAELRALRRQFASRGDIGPRQVEAFLSGNPPEGVDDPRTAAVEDVQLTLESAGVT